MEYYKRIDIISKHFGFKSVNDFAKRGLGYASSEKINRLKRENTKPSIDIIITISNKFEQISVDWILTGKGEMLRNNNLSHISVLSYLKDNIESLIQDERFNYVIDYIIAKKEEIKQRNKIESLFDDFKNKALENAKED